MKFREKSEFCFSLLTIKLSVQYLQSGQIRTDFITFIIYQNMHT